MELTPIKGGRSRKPLDEITPDVIEVVEEAYGYCDSHPDQRLESEPFTTREEAEQFVSDMRAYAYHRKDEAGRLMVTANLAGKPPRVTLRFRVEPYAGPPEDNTEGE